MKLDYYRKLVLFIEESKWKTLSFYVIFGCNERTFLTNFPKKKKKHKIIISINTYHFRHDNQKVLLRILVRKWPKKT